MFLLVPSELAALIRQVARIGGAASKRGKLTGTNMKKEQNDPEWYLQDRRIRKWMVQCVACRRWGYRPDAPPKFHGRVQLEKYLGELKLDERGLCDQCQTASSSDVTSPHRA
jgi:hypothetical protein